MANSIKIKRSAVAAKVPLTTDIELGELAINTYDGKLYLKKDNGTASIVTVNAGGGGSGDVVGPGSSTDNAITRFDGVTGLLIQNSTATLDDSGVVSVSGANVSGLTASSAVATDASKNLVSVANTGTGDNVLATSPTLITPALGTPTALVGTNISGTAAAFTASNVTTNANLTGGVTSVGNAATVVTNANLTGVITSSGNATAIASQTGTGTTFVVNTSPVLVTPNLGTPTAGVLTNCTFPTLNQDTTGTAAKTNALNSATTIVNVSSSTAPTTGQILTATSSTAATWQTPAAGGVTTIGFGTTGLTPSGATSGVVTVAGTLAVANGGTGVTTSTGTVANVLSTSPTLVTPVLGVAAATSLAVSGFVGTSVTGSLLLPVGTTGERSAAANGRIRYNTSTTKYEVARASGAWNPLLERPLYRYFRYLVGGTTAGHHPRVSKLYYINDAGTRQNFVGFTGDNCSDSGTIPSSGNAWVIDLGASAQEVGRGFGGYNVYSGGVRGAYITLAGSNNNSTYVDIMTVNFSTSPACGYYDYYNPNF